MIYFGDWQPDEPHKPAPVGQLCLYCDEPIVASDLGVFMSVMGGEVQPMHRACHLRQLVGSVGHQRQRCSCYGGVEEDPPGLTKRQAAEAAERLFVKRRS